MNFVAWIEDDWNKISLADAALRHWGERGITRTQVFNSLTTYVQVWVRTQQLLPSLMRRKIYCSRTSSLSEEVKIDKDVVAAVLRGTCETLSTSRFYKSVLTESAPDTLLSRIWNESYAQTPTWSPKLKSYMLSGCQMISFNLSGKQ